jgi:lysophospholipase L1-like esterase
MKTLYQTLLCLALLGMVSCGGGSSPEPLTVEINGDSVMAGAGLPNSLPVMLQQMRTDLVVTDKAVIGLSMDSLYKGYTVAYVGAPVPKAGPQPRYGMVKRTASVIVIEVAGIDAYADLPIDVFEAQLRDVLRIIRSEGHVPIVTGIPRMENVGGTFDDAIIARIVAFDKVVHRVAAEEGVTDAHWETVEYNGPSDTLDGIHRTQVAAERLVRRLAETIDAAVKNQGAI